MENAVCYARVSVKDGRGQYPSTEAQIQKIQSYCQFVGLKIVGIFRDEGVSGSKSLEERPEGARMLKMLALGQAKHVVALKLDRLFRKDSYT